MSDDYRVLSREQMAEELGGGISPTLLDAMVREGCPRIALGNRRHGYHPPSVVKWLLAHRMEQAAGVGNEDRACPEDIHGDALPQEQRLPHPVRGSASSAPVGRVGGHSKAHRRAG